MYIDTSQHRRKSIVSLWSRPGTTARSGVGEFSGYPVNRFLTYAPPLR
jgi:hypothetical protein